MDLTLKTQKSFFEFLIDTKRRKSANDPIEYRNKTRNQIIEPKRRRTQHRRIYTTKHKKSQIFVKECLTKVTDKSSFHTYPKECLTKITDKLVEENCSIGWWQSKPSCYLAMVSPHAPQKYAAFVYALAIFQNWNTYLVFLLNSTILIL